jgi:nitroimidazol reductase NimA-like FMN-containing flavoprotein (pyridoxamine 5'-phosphate oxidase superfamily)
MIGVPSSPALDTISDDECRVLLASAQIGRVVLSIDALPAALPVNYRLIDDAIVFRTAPGTKLTAAVNHTVVGFEVDEIDPATRSGWSVLVVGTSYVVSDPAEIARLDRADLRSWAPVPTPRYVRISVQRISGRRLRNPVTNAGAAGAQRP